MTELEQVLQESISLGINQQLDYDKFYLYSIITHSTAIEGSTVTEVEAQLLFDEGITSSKRTMVEQMMNLDLKAAYEFGINMDKTASRDYGRVTYNSFFKSNGAYRKRISYNCWGLFCRKRGTKKSKCNGRNWRYILYAISESS